MKEAALKALAALEACDEIVNNYSNDAGDAKVYPVYAPDGVDIPFITFTLSEGKAATKNAYANQLVVEVYRKKLLDAMDSADAIKEQLKIDGVNSYYQGATVDYSKDLQLAYVIMTFTFNL